RLVKRCTSLSWEHVHGLKNLVLVKEAFLDRQGETMTMKPNNLNPQDLVNSKQWRKLCSYGRAFDINEPIYAKLCHEFYSTYEFNEIVQEDELWSSNLIKFRLARRNHSLTFDEHFNAREHWLSISKEEDPHLSRSHASTIRKPVLRVLQKMISYGLYQRTNGHEKFITRMARRMNLLSKAVLNGLSTLTYCRALDRITLKELIGPNERLITEAPMPGWVTWRYVIRQGVVERMAYRQSYQWDRYAEVFDHMAGVYDISLHGAYNPPRYDQEQYQQYSQQ
nr:hypothetical protein [Tanacetum cinerariifolium]